MVKCTVSFLLHIATFKYQFSFSQFMNYGRSLEERRFEETRKRIQGDAQRQSLDNSVDVMLEPAKIAEMIPLPGNTDGEHYWQIANFLLAQYPTELGVSIASSFGYYKPQTGFDPFGKIMVGVQFVDRKAGSPTMARMSFINEYPEFYEYCTTKNLPERTEKAVDFISTALFQLPNASIVKRTFPTMIVVPEMEDLVKKKLHSIDQVVARYIIG